MATYSFNPFPLLTSIRLTLKPFTKDNLPRIFALRSNVEVAKYLDRPLMGDQQEAPSYLERMQQGVSEGKLIIWGIHFEKEGFVGSICLWNLSEENSTADIGYELLPAFQGRGIMSEAIPLVLQYGFDEMELDRIEAEVHPQNLPSIALLEKYGFLVKDECPDTLGKTFSIYSLSK